MPQQPPVSDADLHAYVDDQLSPQRRQTVEAYLAANPEARASVRRYVELNGLLRQHYGGASGPLRAGRRASARRRRRLTFATAASAAGLACSLGGALLGYQWASASTASIERDLVAPAAFAYAVYAPERRHPVEVGADEEAHLVAWLSKRLHREIRPPNLDSLGYRLIGGRLLPSTDRMAAQFMYEADDGQRITLYLRAGVWSGEPLPFRHDVHDDIDVLYWADGALGYALSGTIGEAELRHIAQAVLAHGPGAARAPA